MTERKLIVPGEMVVNKKALIPHTYTDGVNTYATVLGMLEEDGRFIPLEMRYKPIREDVVVGVVTDIKHSGYIVDVNLPEPAFISTKDFVKQLHYGDIVSCTVGDVDEVGEVDFMEIKSLPSGKVIRFPPAKVPRLIGRKSSMLNLIRDAVNGEVVVGNNGYVWVQGTANIPLALTVFDLIIKKAHTSGLTDFIAQFLTSNKELSTEVDKF